ncbi:hypothetical protein GCM10008085_13910 [Winogradskyella epiphytica]|nr:hypothetical protein GCM10008085_13910 [Winogradskyella epiphytica]
MTHATSDIPRRTIDKFGIQKYYPNQTGYWQGGSHQWMINKLGWPGQLPNSYDNLIAIVGDSFIENFMNPSACHQSFILKKEMPAYNFLEAARSGVTLIESLEISKHIDTLNPKTILIHTGSSDIYESISEIKYQTDVTQLSTDDKVLQRGKLKSPGLKKVLYSWKLLYYFYNRFPLNLTINSTKSTENRTIVRSKFEIHETRVRILLDYIKDHYNLDNKIFVFKPSSEKDLVDMFKSLGLNTIILDSSEESSWTFDYDSHWTCYGHERVANQIKLALIRDFPNLIN